MAKVFGQFNVTLGDEKYLWTPDDWNLDVWLQIETDLQLDAGQFTIGVLKHNNIRASQWLVWYLRKLAGREEDRLGVNFPFLQLGIEKAPDPESPAAGTPPSDASGLSPSSSGSE